MDDIGWIVLLDQTLNVQRRWEKRKVIQSPTRLCAVELFLQQINPAHTTGFPFAYLRPNPFPFSFENASGYMYSEFLCVCP